MIIDLLAHYVFLYQSSPQLTEWVNWPKWFTRNQQRFWVPAIPRVPFLDMHIKTWKISQIIWNGHDTQVQEIFFTNTWKMLSRTTQGSLKHFWQCLTCNFDLLKSTYLHLNTIIQSFIDQPNKHIKRNKFDSLKKPTHMKIITQAVGVIFEPII